MRRLIALSLLIPIHAKADSAIKTAWEACRKSEMTVCRSLENTIENVERKLENQLEELGIKKATVITASTANILIQKRVRVSTGSWDAIGNDRSVLEIDEEKVELNLEWRF